jgi:hypothetical protein
MSKYKLTNIRRKNNCGLNHIELNRPNTPLPGSRAIKSSYQEVKRGYGINTRKGIRSIPPFQCSK